MGREMREGANGGNGMRRLLQVILVGLLVALSAVGCKPVEPPANAIPVLDAKFKYRGTMIWLYQNSSGKVGMLRGNYRDITAVTKDNVRFRAADDGLFTSGQGQWTSIREVKHNMTVYIKEELVDDSQKQAVIEQPDYVLFVDLEELRPLMPQINSEDELNRLKEDFQAEMQVDMNPVVTITMDSGAEIKLELYPDVAPNTVNNFVYLTQYGFYDGTIFHRVIPEFMIQGGDPLGIGMGGPGYGIPGEFAANGFNNPLLHTRGILSMARGDDPNSAGSQFFIMVEDTSDLDGLYAAFGSVLSGMEEVDRIVNLLTDENDRPLEPPTMVRVTVETFGATYPPPMVMVNK